MPNWVYNGLTIEGSPDQVTKLIEQMNKPFVDSIQADGDLAYSIKERKFSNPIFSFRNIIAPTDLEAYHSQPTLEGPLLSFQGNDWYNFNNREWGTKWDVAVADDDKDTQTYIEGPISNGDNHAIYYSFDTAWAPPLAAIAKLSAQYPTLLFTLNYREEGGWGGEVEFLRGAENSHSTYDNQCEECNYEYSDDEYINAEREGCENCYGVCPKCGFSYDLCEIHQAEYNAKSIEKYNSLKQEAK
jgi:hypothetical protein